MAFGRRATGRDEMLKRNQQRIKKRKAPSNPAPKAKTSTTKTAYSGKQMADIPKVNPVGGKKNKLPSIKGQKPKTTTTANRPAPKSPPVSQAKTSPAPSSPDKTPARQQASTTRSNRNRGMTGYGYTGGRGGSSKPSSSKPQRSSYGPGRSGSAAYNRALQAWKRKNNTSETKEKLKVNRRGRRV